MSEEKPKINKIFNHINIKAIFLIALTTLVIINTCTLAYLVPIFGYHIMPDNQAGAELWRVIISIMSICTSLIIACIIIYGTTKVVKMVSKNE